MTIEEYTGAVADLEEGIYPQPPELYSLAQSAQWLDAELAGAAWNPWVRDAINSLRTRLAGIRRRQAGVSPHDLPRAR